MINRKKLYENMKRLVKVDSISGTAAEGAAAYELEAMLREIPYFKEHEENVMVLPVEGDPFQRAIVAAYLECDPDCPDTIILTGHYDVVDIEEYGSLKEIACDVEEITKRIGELHLDEECKKDLESGNW